MEDIEATGGIIGALKRRIPRRKKKKKNMTGEQPISLVINLPWVIPLPNFPNRLDIVLIMEVIHIRGEQQMIQKKPEF